MAGCTEDTLVVAPRAASTSSKAHVANILWKMQTDGFHRHRNQRVTLADFSESERQEMQEVFNDLANGEGTTDGALHMIMKQCIQ